MIKIINIVKIFIYPLLISFLLVNMVYAQNDSELQTVTRPPNISPELSSDKDSKLEENDSDLLLTVVDQPSSEISENKNSYYIPIIVGILLIVWIIFRMIRRIQASKESYYQ